MIAASKLKKYQKTIEQENKDFLLTLLVALEDNSSQNFYQKEAEKEITLRNRIAVSKIINN